MIRKLSDINGIGTHNHLVRKQTLDHLAKLVWLNGRVFIYVLSGCGFESRCCHLNFRYRASFEQGFPWHSGNYRVQIHYETRTWHDNNIQLRKLWLISKLTGQKVITIHILLDVSRSKADQTMKFGQLIEHNMRNIFFEKFYTKCDGEVSPSPFYRKSKLSISLDQQFEML